MATAKDETPAEKISRLEKELAEARAEAEKHTAILVLDAPKDVDAEVKRLLRLAWERG